MESLDSVFFTSLNSTGLSSRMAIKFDGQSALQCPQAAKPSSCEHAHRDAMMVDDPEGDLRLVAEEIDGVALAVHAPAEAVVK